MATGLYKLGKQKILSAQINFLTDTLKAVLVKNTYIQDLTNDEFLTSVSAHVLNTAQTLTSKSVALGVFDADDVVYPSVTAGDTSEGVVIYKEGGSAAASPLLAYIDNITGFPLLTNGGNVTVQWDAAINKIFSL